MTKHPKNVEWIVSGTAKFRGVSATVHAPDRQEAIRKANAGQYFGGIEIECAELVDYEFNLAEVGIDHD